MRGGGIRKRQPKLPPLILTFSSRQRRASSATSTGRRDNRGALAQRPLQPTHGDDLATARLDPLNGRRQRLGNDAHVMRIRM